MWTRRQALFGGTALLGAGLSAPRRGWAAAAPADRKFVFVLAKGGWDVGRIFAPVFSPYVDRARSDEIARAGDLSWVSNPRRPAVDLFFSVNRDRLATVDGMLIRSVNHRMCRRLWISDRTASDAPDWPTRLGAAAADRFGVPHLVVQGSVIGAEDEYLTALTGNGGQMESLLDGSAITTADTPVALPPLSTDALTDAFALAAGERSRARSPEHAGLLHAWTESVSRLATFQERASPLDLSGDLSSFGTQISQALAYLGAGTSRCVSLLLPYDFDTHYGDELQTPNLDATFQGLLNLDHGLRTTPGTVAPTLADETVVVVYSEMARTPYLTGSGGREHWMYTSCLLWGPGVRGGTQIGGYDDHLVGLPVDLASGGVDPTRGVPLTPDVMGSTLLRLGGLDPAAELGADTSLPSLIDG